MRIVIATAVALALSAPLAHAHPAAHHHKAGRSSHALARAKELNRKGLAAYRRHDYDAAIAAFDEAYALTGAPGVLYNLAQAHRLAGHCAAAFADYERFVRALPHAPQARFARHHMAELKRCAPARLRAAASTTAKSKHPGEQTRAHHRKAGPAAGPKSGPGPAALSTAVPGGSQASTGSRAAGSLTQRPGHADAGRTKRLAGIGVGVAGVGLTVAAVVFGAQASSAASDLTSRFKKGGTWDKSARDLQSRGQSRETLAIICGVAGVAGLVGGGMLYYLGRKDRETDSGGARLSVAPLPGGGAAVVYAGTL